MIARLWSAQATEARATAYPDHLRSHVLPAVRMVDGYAGAMLFERRASHRVEIIVITLWRSLDSIRGFAGADLEAAVVTAEAASLLTRFDRRVRHYESIVRDDAEPNSGPVGRIWDPSAVVVLSTAPEVAMPRKSPSGGIARLWHGRTRESTANEYAKYLYQEGVKKLRSIKGNRGVQVFRRVHEGIAEFITISYWESRDAIRAYAGKDIEKTQHLPKDPEYLLELEPTVKHFDILVSEWSGEGPR